MTNFEKWKNEITNIRFAVVNGKPTNCRGISCTNCLFKEWDSCADARLEWLKAKYVEPAIDWSTVPIDTKVLVSDSGNIWNNRYYAGLDSNDNPTVWANGATSWSVPSTEDWNKIRWVYIKLAEEYEGRRWNGVI